MKKRANKVIIETKVPCEIYIMSTLFFLIICGLLACLIMSAAKDRKDILKIKEQNQCAEGWL